jgi:DnaJ-class molecular chaperone
VFAFEKMEYKDYYKVLGVEKGASQDQIRAAYRKLARKFHPDVNPGNKQAEQRFKEINEAHAVISDPDKRRKYDELGSNWERVVKDQEYARQYRSAPRGGGGIPQGFDFGDVSDFFSQFFGGEAPSGFQWTSGFPSQGGERGMASGGADIEHEIEVTLEEAFRGGSRSLRMQVETVCPACRGEGIVARDSRTRDGKRTVRSAAPCGNCHGSGAALEIRNIDVTIPKGVTEGTKIRLAGQGGRSAGGGSEGDLYLKVKILPHPFFHVEGHDLLCDVSVSYDDAMLGGEIELPALQGPLSLRIPPGTQGGKQMRLRGQGLPMPGGAGPGDIIARVNIVVPASLTSDERNLVENLREIRLRRGR